jgi:pyochelin biosynthetic protein PchC
VVLRSSKWTTVFHRKPASRYRVVFFPHAGGSAGAGAPFSAIAPPSTEVVTIQYPGRQWRRAEAPATDIRELAVGVAEELLALADKPTAIFGHSMGALVAFEATRLVEKNRPGLVTRLFASGSSAPSRPRRLQMGDDASDDEIIAELRLMGGTDESLVTDREALQLILPALRDDYRAMARYSCEPGVLIDAPISALLGVDDVSTSYQDAAQWGAHTRSGAEVRTFPGGHFYLSQHRRELLETIQETSWRSVI